MSLIFFVILTYIAYTDYKYFRIPNKSILLLLFLKLFNYFIPNSNIITATQYKVAIISFISFLCLHIVFKGSLGAGDVKLLGVLGLYLKPELYLNCIFLSFFLAGITGIFLSIFHKSKKQGALPFAPFVFIAVVIFSILK